MSRTAASSGRAARAVPGNDQQITVAPFFMASATSRTRHKNTCTVASPGFWCPTSTTQRQRHRRLPKHLLVSRCVAEDGGHRVMTTQASMAAPVEETSPPVTISSPLAMPSRTNSRGMANTAIQPTAK
jgi:hypothetical protein